MKKLVLSTVIALAINAPAFANDVAQELIRAEQISFSASMKTSMEKMQAVKTPADYQAIIAEQKTAQAAHVAKMRELMQTNRPASIAPAAPAVKNMPTVTALTAEQMNAHRQAITQAQEANMEAMKNFMAKVQAAKTDAERTILNKEYDVLMAAHMEKMKSINEASFSVSAPIAAVKVEVVAPVTK